MKDIILCEYGCEREAKHQLKNGKWCCESNCNSCPNKRKRMALSVSRAHKEGRCIPPGYNALKESARIRFINRKQMTDWKITQLPFDQLNKKHKKIKLLKEQNNKCDICGIDPIWNGKLLSFHMDHIDGDHGNNKRENLRMICPNCHSQTDTFGSKNLSDEGRERMRKAEKETHQSRCEMANQRRKQIKDLYNAVVAQSADASA